MTKRRLTIDIGGDANGVEAILILDAPTLVARAGRMGMVALATPSTNIKDAAISHVPVEGCVGTMGAGLILAGVACVCSAATATAVWSGHRQHPMRLRGAVHCKQATSQAGKQVAANRIARSRYQIVEKVEAGIALTGTEVKSCRAGKINLRDGFAGVENGEMWLKNVHIAKHATTSAYFQHEERRPRRLLLHRKEIRRLAQTADGEGYTLVPLRAYFSQGNLLKVELAVARGLKLYDKRAKLKDAAIARDAAREVKNFGV